MLTLVVALPAEAQPLCEHFGLTKVSTPGDVAMFESEQLRLIQTGVGTVAAASAVGYVAGRYAAQQTLAWLNVGIAGHRSLPVGTACLGYKVTDAATNRSWYPPVTFESACANTTIRTVTEASNDYPHECAYDMEAAGFCAAASRFSTSELVHCLKIISDNPTEPSHRVTSALVRELLSAQLPSISSVVATLSEIRAELATINADPPAFPLLCERFRFTHTERNQLRRLLTQHAALAPDTDLTVMLNTQGSGKQVLLVLKDQVGALALAFAGPNT